MNIVTDKAHVWKLGRSTSWTDGNVLTIDQQVTTEYVANGRKYYALFHDQISIEGRHGDFSQPGDSGAMILNDDNDAVALLYAGTETGGSNGGGITFANPMIRVMQTLGADF